MEVDRVLFPTPPSFPFQRRLLRLQKVCSLEPQPSQSRDHSAPHQVELRLLQSLEAEQLLELVLLLEPDQSQLPFLVTGQIKEFSLVQHRSESYRVDRRFPMELLLDLRRSASQGRVISNILRQVTPRSESQPTPFWLERELLLAQLHSPSVQRQILKH